MITIKKKIIFGITSLTLGGAERVLVDLSNKLCDKYDITIFSIYDDGELKAELGKKIKFKSLYKCRYDELGEMRKKWIPIKIFLFSNIIYNKFIKGNYDVEIAFLEGPITRLLSHENGNTRKIVWIHNDIKYVFGKGIKAKIKKVVDKSIYTKYNDMVFVSKENQESFCKVYNNIDYKCMHVVYNYIDKKRILEKAGGSVPEFNNHDGKIFVCVCRLVQQKAIDRLIIIHKKLLNSGYYHNFFIIGDGPERDKLEHLVKTENVGGTFHILGKRQNPYPYIKKADYFCLLSYFEGYGMVLEEAKILLKKIILTNTAAKEAVEGYEYALIVDNDSKAIYEGLADAISGKVFLKEKVYSYKHRTNIDEIIKLLDD